MAGDFDPLNPLVPVSPTGGMQRIKQSGERFAYESEMAANADPVTSDWMDTEGYTSINFVVFSNKGGRYTIEFTQNPDIPTYLPPVNVSFNTEGVMTPRAGAINPRLRYARLTYYNSSNETAHVLICIQLNVGLSQSSIESLGANAADTRLANVQKVGAINIKDDNGDYGFVERTGNALNVYDEGLLAVAKESTLQSILTALNGTLKIKEQTPLDISGLATQATIQAILNKLISAPSTAANQTSEIAKLDAILQKIIADPATQTTLAAVLSKLSNDPATATNQTAQAATLTNIFNRLSTDPATQTTLNLLYQLFVSGNAKSAVSLLGTDAGIQALISSLNSGNNKTQASLLATDPGIQALLTPQGTKADTPATDATGAWSVIALLKYIAQLTKANAGNGGYANKAYYQSSAAATGAIGNFTLVAAGARVVGNLAIFNNSSTVKTVLFYDKASIPVTGDTAAHAYPIPANTSIIFPLSSTGVKYANGIGFGIANGGGLLGGVLNALVAGDITINIDYN